MNELMTAKDIQKALKVSITTARELMQSNEFPSFQINESEKRRIFRVYEVDFKAWLESKRKMKEVI